MTKKKKKRTGLTAGIFVGLKILEAIAILVVVFGFYYLGEFVCSSGLNCSWEPPLVMWFVGFLTIVVGILLLIIIAYLIIGLIQTNWNWAKRISKAFKSKRS